MPSNGATMRSRAGGLGQRQLRFGHLQVGRAFVDARCADEVLRQQLLVAPVVGAAIESSASACCIAPAAAGRPVAPAAGRAARGRRRGIDLRDPPAHFGPQHHALARPQAADGLRVVGEADRLDRATSTAGGRAPLAGAAASGRASAAPPVGARHCRGSPRLAGLFWYHHAAPEAAAMPATATAV